MRPRLISCLVAASLALTGLPAAYSAVSAQETEPEQCHPGVVCAGYGAADATWHVGAGAGQYTEKDPDAVSGVENGTTGELGDGSIDPHNHSTTQRNSYGVHSRLSYRAVVVQDPEGDHVAFVKSDSYLAQDYLIRRVGQILEAEDSEVTYDEIFMMASHNHSSPYYTSPSWGVWLFQDAFDLRAFEYHARSMAQAILDAEGSLADARMGATKIDHKLFKGMIARRTVTDDGTPAGYPLDFGDFGLDVLRFETLGGDPIAAMAIWGQHPEGLEPHDLITGDFIAPLERFVEDLTDAPLVFGQGDVGSAEAGPAFPDLIPEGIPRRWSHAGHAQTERGAFLLARDVERAWDAIGVGVPVGDQPIVEFSSTFDVAAGNAWMPGPLSHPYPSVSNCRTERSAEGSPGAPVAGLPDCERADWRDGREAHNTDDPLWDAAEDEFGQEDPVDPVAEPAVDGAYDVAEDALSDWELIWENMKAHGIPAPEHYDAPAFTGVEENLRMHLQAFKMGEVILMSCACEAQVDLILNLESRTDDKEGNFWDGYDWTKRLDCNKADGTWKCSRDPDDPAVVTATFPQALTFSDAAYQRMTKQVHNDAAGWNDPEYLPFANSEPDNPENIKGNFTKTELPAGQGYTLPIGVGHAGDYNGYTVSYREYMAYDHYRKALTSYGPHTADFMNTTLVTLAGVVNDDDPDNEYPYDPEDLARHLADEARQEAAARVIGIASGNAYDQWRESLPDDAGEAEPVEGGQPTDITRFAATTFTWRGGSNAVDNPTVVVQRKVDGDWKTFADQSGEVQTKLTFPKGADGLLDTYQGNQEWLWTANFEAFNPLPKEIGNTPAGTYRFFVEGSIRKGGDDVPYRFPSNEFEVKPWNGIEVGDLTLNADRSVSFKVEDIRYPQTYESSFPYIEVDMIPETGDGEIPADERKTFCATCSFRPWATGSTVASASVTVERFDGSTEQVKAELGSDGLWHANTDLYKGDRAWIAPGGVVDGYGEANASATSVREGEEPRPTPTPTETASPTPTEEPPAPTTVTLTDTSSRAVQYTDEATLQARVADEDGPISGAEVVFELLGADGTSSWTATSGADGIASVTFTAERIPAGYTLTARYAGNEGHLGSADVEPFTVDKEDAKTALTVEGKGGSRSLRARLSDKDSDDPVADRRVVFSADGDELGSARTSDQGVAKLDLPAKYRNGHHDYVARFVGDDFYLASSDRRQT